MNTQEIDLAYQVDRMNEETIRHYRAKVVLWGHHRWIDLPCKDILEALNKCVTKKVRIAKTKLLGNEVDEDTGIEYQRFEVTVDLGGKMVRKEMTSESPYDLLYQVSSRHLVIEEIDEVDTDTDTVEYAADETAGDTL